MSCGKVASRTPGLGAQSMKVSDMNKFIQEHGTQEAKDTLRAMKAVKGTVTREDLCEILHMFKAGRDEIRKGIGMHKLKSPVVSSSSSSASSGSNNSSSSARSSSSSNAGTISNAMRQLRGAMTANRLKKLRMKKAFSALKGKNRVKSQFRKVMQGGVPILMLKKSNYVAPLPAYPRVIGQALNKYVSGSGSNVNNMNRANSGKSNSNGSGSASGYGSNRGMNNEAEYTFANFQNLRAKRGLNKDPRSAKMSRFSRGVRLRKVMKTNRIKPLKFKKAPVKFMKFGSDNSRVPTRSTIRSTGGGSQSRMTREQLRQADELRWKMYEREMRNDMNTENRSKLANKLMNVAIKQVRELPMKVRSPRSPRSQRVRVSPSSGSSNNNSPMKRSKKLSIQQQIMRKFAKRRTGTMNFSKRPIDYVNAKNQVKNLLKKLGSASSASSASSSSSASPVQKKKVVSVKSVKSGGAMKSLRKK